MISTLRNIIKKTVVIFYIIIMPCYKADIKRYFNGRINTFTYILYVLTYVYKIRNTDNY